jgi:hypothetical protein
MIISKYVKWSTFLVVNLTLGMSLPLYAAGPNPDLTPTTTMSVSSTRTTMTRTHHRHHHYGYDRHMRHYHHYRHHCYQRLDCHKHQYFAQDISRDSIERVQQNNRNADRVVWKNGVIYHDVNPTGQIQHVPESTSDTLHGSVTTTDEHQ